MASMMGNLKNLPNKILDIFSGLLGKSASESSGNATGNISGLKQILIPLLGLLALMLLAFYVIDQVKVNGPVYGQLKAQDELRADILPPPLFAEGAFASANEAFVATSAGDYEKRDRKLAEIERIEKEFKTRAAFWGSRKDSGSMKGSFLAVLKANENFYDIYRNKFLPAIKIGAIASATPLAELTGAFEVSKQTVNVLNTEVEKETRRIEQDAKNQLKKYLTILGLLGLLIAAVMTYFGMRQAKQVTSALEALESTGQANQTAVLNLLDEMGDLADGDLTVNAKVSENITGAIADSINYTISSLRELVGEINRATDQVNTATESAQTTSSSLISAAEQQSNQITETTEAVTNMTRSILQVSTNAGQASQVAQRSLEAASQGSVAVQNTIAGMNGIREQIQETSKRIKRLGESTQEISEIVELISDITEQTNILALNAAIQAASAGEAGRGFTVVAEEVQRLAERSSEATKQISAIVKTIQTDTNSAVAAMEKSTEGVVEGAKLSDAAGRALTEIETVSTNLARLIQSISAATEAQTQVAAKVTKNMQQIQEVTSQTTEGTKTTAESIGQLRNLAEDLKSSVAGFKLA